MKFPFRTSPILLLTSLIGVTIINLTAEGGHPAGSPPIISGERLTFKSNLTPVVHAQKASELAQDTATAENPLVVIAYLQVKPEHRQTFLELANNVVKTTNETEEGAISYNFYESQDMPNLFFFFEDWQNEAAFEEHLQKAHTKSLTDKYPEILAEPAEVRIYDIENIEQLQIP